ncbi:MAG: peptide chain release factor N(5)-glutamine methyltransferase [Phycisphaeraceae bacterium]|nr:peptide chain release factor N(5)-glutamine methyltransferase [Phycisphaeraceae bacterium]
MGSSQAIQGPWTTRRLIQWIGDAFARADLDSPRLSAELLLSHVIGCDRIRLYTDPDRPASPLERDSLRELVSRALKHEPIQYLTGEAWFHSLPFHVDKRVLVPRPATETIIEQLLAHARSQPGFGGRMNSGEGLTIADICTGSGCVAVALLKTLPHARAVAVDISADALEVARQNASRHGVSDRLDLLRGDLLAPLDGHPMGLHLHYITANPPYISDAEWDDVPPNVKLHEPTIALRGGADGLELVRRLINDAPSRLRPGGMLLIELGSAGADHALRAANESPSLRDARICPDFEGLPRVLVARRTE